MTARRPGSSFIQYALPVLAGGKPPKPPDSQEGSQGKPRPVTTLAVGEESGTPRPGGVTTMVVGEESGTGA